MLPNFFQRQSVCTNVLLRKNKTKPFTTAYFHEVLRQGHIRKDWISFHIPCRFLLKISLKLPIFWVLLSIKDKLRIFTSSNNQKNVAIILKLWTTYSHPVPFFHFYFFRYFDCSVTPLSEKWLSPGPLTVPPLSFGLKFFIPNVQ